jgi:hypothetical protein
MGHLRLGKLPLYKNWQQVVGTLSDPSESLGRVAAETARAAQRKLRNSANSPYLWYPYWLLIKLANHAREPDDFERFLRHEMIGLEEEDSAVAFVSALTRALDHRRDDFGPPTAIDELSLDAFQQAVCEIVLTEADSLFGTTTEDLRLAFARFAPRRPFGKLSRVFLGAFFGQLLRYFLSHELGNHVGLQKRFSSLDKAEEFNRGLEVYARQVSDLVEEFGEGWYSKRLWQKGDISQDDVRRFLHVAFQKFQQQLELEAR